MTDARKPARKPETRKPVPKKPGKAILSKKEVREKKRFRKPDWEREIEK